jgi:hypothetical protein
MSTAAQIAANRENAQRSTGPTTEEGKSRSSRNHHKHGFCGEFRVLANEDQNAFDRLLQSLRDEHQPGTPTENILVDRMAQHYWLSQRAQLLQTEAFTSNRSDSEAERAFALFLRYQSTNDRAFSKCLTDLLKLRAERRKQEIGFEREKQREAESIRKQEALEAKTRLTRAQAAHQERETEVKPLMETRLPRRSATENFAAELDANPEISQAIKAA